jgi:hypothetical protein
MMPVAAKKDLVGGNQLKSADVTVLRRDWQRDAGEKDMERLA